jgi:hypothetical protein
MAFMIIGAHSIIYSTDPDADRAFLRDILELTHVDVGEGWLIFGLPPSEVAVHPADTNGEHEFFLMVDDVDDFVAEMRHRNVAVKDAEDHGWGVMTQITLPGGGAVSVYQPRHERPSSMPSKAKARRKASRTTKKTSGKNTPGKASRRSTLSKKAAKKKARRR